MPFQWGKSAKNTSLAGLMAVSAVSGYVFGDRSKLNLKDVHPDLILVAQRCLQKSEIDFMVIDGMRTEEEQRQNIANGVSWTLRSRHLTGKAIDFVALVDNKVSYKLEYYVKITAACKQAANELKIPIVAGIDWKQVDAGHIELDKRVYP